MLQTSDVYRAWVRNRARLSYNSVASWLEGGNPLDAVTAVQNLAENLQMQNQAAQAMKNFRHSHGALSLETIQARPIFDGDQIQYLEVQ